MRFMMLMIPNVTQSYGTPPADAVEKMSRYNEALAKAGVLLALDGLQGTDKGARISFGATKNSVLDGPFSEAKEVLGGYWMIQVKSKAEAVEWARRCPAAEGDVIEVRQVFEMSDFPPEVQAVATQVL